jgi:hypothetical protein
MTVHVRAEGRQRTWSRRIVTLLGCWVVLWVVTSWVQMHPQPLGLLAALGVFFVICWWASDRRINWDPVEWEGDPIGRRLLSTADSRTSYLRRLIDDASIRSDNGTNASAASLQAILRDVAVDRLRLRAAAKGATSEPDDAELLDDTDPQLAEYFRAQPAPPINRQSVTDIINRIEAL